MPDPSMSQSVSRPCDCLTPGKGQHYRLTCTAPNPIEDFRLFGAPVTFIGAEAWAAMKRLRAEGPKALPDKPLPRSDD